MICCMSRTPRFPSRLPAPSRRQRIALLAGVYVAVVALWIPATWLLIDRNVPVAVALLLGLLLAHIGVVTLLIPIRVYLAIREYRRDRDSN